MRKIETCWTCSSIEGVTKREEKMDNVEDMIHPSYMFTKRKIQKNDLV